LSTYNHFGCDLFLAGAAEAYAERQQLPDKTKEIMAAVIRAAGRANDRASQFADKHENYLLEPRYLDMFRAGRDAMTVYMKDEEMRGKAASGQLSKDDEAAMAADHHGGEIGMFLENALEHWNNKADKKKEGGMIAVMFTAMVNAFTEAAADETAAKLVHAHNRAVREALRRYSGSEVKQTNDGIMASFPQASLAVEAAVAIMRDIEMNSSAQLPLHIKIGINAGEPIAENNDLFGTPVQLAARVCAFAASDQIAVSKLVRDLCQGKGLNFNDLGQAEFKGFGEKMPVYEAVWREGMLPE
jgi:adenylate cyclase